MRVLLVDHDSEGLEAISRSIRGVLELDCVSSKGDALLLLRQNTYDVLIACERCVDGSGLDLLGRTTRTAVPLKRIFAAAPERLQLLGPRLAPFKVQRTINYPIDLEELWLAIAQVTGDPNDETDGTIERVVLDERGIPSSGSVPRAPIPPRPPAPLAAVPSPPQVSPAIASASGGRATARLAQPAPEPPPRAPPRVAPRAPEAAPPARAPAPPRKPEIQAVPRALDARPALRSSAPALKPLDPMPIGREIAPEPAFLPAWTPETPVDDFAQVAEQARVGIRQKTVDEAQRRKRYRLLAACAIAVVVAGGIVMLIEKFYDPEARAREKAIAAEVSRMTEQQKVTDRITMIEVDIETAIMNNDLDVARRELATLVEHAPTHPRREFLQASIDRAAELARLAPQAQAVAQPAPASAPPPPRAAQPAERVAQRQAAAPRNDRAVAPRALPADTTPAPRTYGAPIGEAPRARLPLDAPINTAPTATFSGRTVEAGDPQLSRAPTPAPAPAPVSTSGVSRETAPAAGSAVPPQNVAAAEPPAPPPPVDVVPAKIQKRVMPVAPSGISRRTSGYVVVTFGISESGKVTSVDVIESEPRGVFDDAATTAVRKWVYEPRKENGVSVASLGKARLVFEPAD